jgi:hypothetical protein
MRNDARPIGEDTGRQSPVPSDRTAGDRGRSRSDSRDRVTHDRESHIVNRPAENTARRKEADVDPVMPAGDATLNTKI